MRKCFDAIEGFGGKFRTKLDSSLNVAPGSSVGQKTPRNYGRTYVSLFLVVSAAQITSQAVEFQQDAVSIK